MAFNSSILAQLNVSNSLIPTQLVNNVLAGDGVSISNVSYSGANISLGKFSNGLSTNIGMDEGILLSTGNVFNAIGPNNYMNKTTNTLGGSDVQLASLVPGYSIFDAASLEFDFIPMSDTLKLEYVFASEEYPEWVGSTFNDVFGFFVSGANPVGGNYNNYNLALVPNTSLAVTVNNINNGPFNNGPCNNCGYYANNANGSTIEYDGFTHVMKVCLIVVPCTSYHIKIAIGDVGDHSYDSGIFLKSNSFSSNVISLNKTQSNFPDTVTVEGCSSSLVTFSLTHPTTYNRVIHYTIGGTAQNGIDYVHIPDSIVIPTNFDSVSLLISPNIDSLAEGIENIMLIVQTSSCSQDTLIVYLADYTMPSVVINSPNTACQGDSINLHAIVSNGSLPYTYSWNSADSTASIVKKINNSTNFIVSITDFCGNTVSDSLNISAFALPTLIVNASDTVICQNDTSFLQVNGANTYNWIPSSSLSSSTANNVFALPLSSTNYTVIGTDLNACRDTANIQIDVLPVPSLSITTNYNNICIGDSVSINVTGANLYIWNPTSGLNPTAGSAVVAKPNLTTIYKVSGIGANGCVSKDSINIIVHNSPSINIVPANPSICFGQTKNLNVNGALTYLWSPATNLSSVNGSSVVSNTTSNITYFVLGTDIWGCKNSDSVVVTVNSLPQLTVSPSDTLICKNTSATINVSGAATYSWLPSSTLSAPTGSSVIANPTISTTYLVVGIDNNGCSDTAISSIHISAPPVITPQSQTICKGDIATLSANSNTSGSSILWSTGETSSSILVSPSVTTNYSLTAIDTIGCTSSAQATVNVNPLPSLTISPNTPTICKGDSVLMTVSGAINYVWSPGIGLSSTTASSIIAKPAITTTYKVIGTNIYGCVDSAFVTISVNNLPTISINHKDTLVCKGSSFTLNASGGSSYSWNPTTFLSSSNTSSVTVTPSTNITYIVTGIDINGCVNHDTSKIYVSPIITASATPMQICVYDSSKLNVISNHTASFLWNTGETSSLFYVKPIVTTTYSVTATDTIGCSASTSVTIIVNNKPVISISPANQNLCSGSSDTITASGGFSYIWSPSASLSSSTAATVIASPNASTTYTVIGSTQAGCKDTAYANIMVIPSPTVVLTPNTISKCIGDSTVMTASGANTFQWFPSAGLSATTGNSVTGTPLNTTVYKVIGTAANGCTDSAFSTLIINQKPVLSVSPDSTDICLSQSINLTAAGAQTYQWSPVNSLSSANGATVIATPNISTTYTLIGISSANCSDSIKAFVGVHSYPIISINPINPHLCPDDSIQLIGSGSDNYIWNPATGLSSSNNDSVIAKPSQTTIYQLIGSNAFGCTDTLSSTITVSPIPVISPINPSICSGDSVELTVTSNTSSSTFVWSTGAVSSSIWVHPNATTNYIVTASDSSGCSKSVSTNVYVNSIPILSITPLNPEICPGESVNINANGANSYNWSPNSTLSNNSGNNVTASPSTTSTYKLVGFSTSGCSDSINFQVIVNSAPTVTVSPVAATFCGGLSQTLIASGASSYLWQPSAGLSTNTNDTSIATPSTTTAYLVIGTDSNGCSDSAISLLTVYSEPVISHNTLNICPNDTVNLTASAPGATTYLWSNGATTSTIAVNPNITTNYTVTVNYPCGCVKSSSVIVNVYNDPKVHAGATNYSICIGDTTELFGSNSVSYIWSPTANVSQTAGTHIHAWPSVTTTYNVVGTSMHSCKSTDTVQISIFPATNIVASTSASIICIGDTAILQATGGSTYHWSPGNGLVNNNLAQVYANPNTSTTYFVRGVDTNGCSNQDSIFIKVDPGPVINITPANPIICQGDTINLTGSGANTYFWTPNVWLLGANMQVATIFPSSNIVYSVTGIDSNGCSTIQSVYVNVKRKPIIYVFPPLDSICEGDSIMIFAMGSGNNGSYNWSPSAGLSSTVGDTIFASPSVNTTYEITGVSTDGCSKTNEAIIKVHPKPLVTVSSNNQTICRGDSASITAFGANNYFWNNPSSIYSNSGNIVGVNPFFSTNYSVIGTNIYGCSDSTNSQINVNQLPNIKISALDSSLCIGDSTMLFAVGGMSYIWNSNPSLNQNIGSAVGALPLLTTKYYVSGTDSNTCVNSDSLQILVNPRPIIGIIPSSLNICAASQIQLSCQSNMNPTQFVWNTGDSVNMITKYPISNTTYKVNGFNIFGCEDSASANIIVNQYPQLTLNHYDTIICDYDSLNLVGGSNINPVNFQWNNLLTNNNITVAPNTLTTYRLIISDSIGCSDTAFSTVDVQTMPTVAVSSSKPHSCAGDSVIFSAAASASVAFYLWNNLVVTPSNILSPISSAWHKVTVIDSIGCFNSDSIYQSVNPIPQISVIPSVSQICFGDTTILSASSTVNPINFYWSNGSSASSIIVDPTISTNYSLVATDSIGCKDSVASLVTVYALPIVEILPANPHICIGDSITLSANSIPSATNYFWNTSDTNSNVTISPSSNTTYSIQIEDIHNCKNTLSKTVIVNQLPNISITPNTIGICSGDSVQLTINSSSILKSILWSTLDTTTFCIVKPNISNNYWADIIDTNNCKNSDTAKILVTPRPTNTISSQDSIICSADSTKVSYSGTGTNAAQFNWNYDGGIHLSGNGKLPHWLKWNNGGWKNIILTVSENGCTSYPDTAKILVNQTPIIDFVATPTESCESLLVNFENRTPNIKTYRWNFGNPFESNDTSSFENPDYSYANAGSYTVGLYGISYEGCAAYGYKSSYINVHPNPKAKFGAFPRETLITTPNVSIWDFSTDAVTWLYNFDDPKSGINNTSTFNYPWHEFKDTGLFNISLVVTNVYGCTDTAWQQERINPFAQLYFPNAFTPNGDGLNDVFEIKGHDFDWETYQINIYNRWGQVVFQSNDINKTWDGKMVNSNEFCPPGVYNLIINVKDKKHHKNKFTGSVTLLK